MFALFDYAEYFLITIVLCVSTALQCLVRQWQEVTYCWQLVDVKVVRINCPCVVSTVYEVYLTVADAAADVTVEGIETLCFDAAVTTP